MKTVNESVVEVDGKEYMKNGRGDLVPVSSIKDVDKLRDEIVRNIINKATSTSEVIKVFKKEALEEANTFCEISLEKHGRKYGGKKGNINLTSFDGEYKITIEMQDALDFDEQIQAAKELVVQCALKWSDGANENLKIIVNEAFRVDKKGNMDMKRILELRRYDIDDPDWNKAMEIISESLQVSFSKRYMRFYNRDSEGKYHQILLDFSAV